MPRRKQQKAWQRATPHPERFDIREARQLLKCTIVILRDHSDMRFDDFMMEGALTWRLCEGLEQEPGAVMGGPPE